MLRTHTLSLMSICTRYITGHAILPLSVLIFMLSSCQSEQRSEIRVNIDSVLADVVNHPIGINVDYFMDDDHYLRPERSTVDALKAMGVKFLRYPGGEKSDFYLFSVPPYEESIPTLSRTGRGAVRGRGKVLDNYSTFNRDVLDFDEFMEMCRDVGAEPIIVVAADEYLNDYPDGTTVTGKEGLLTNAVEWVRYANVKKGYSVRYWMIGNESWHPENTHSTPEIYARDVVDFSRAMKAVDPSILIIPNGRTMEEWATILPIVVDDIDLLCISNYPVYNYRAGYATYRDTLQNLVGGIDIALEAVDRFTPEKREQFKVVVAEYGPFDWGNGWPLVNDQGHNLATFEMTGLHLNNPRVLFSTFWNTRWINNNEREDSVFDALDQEGYFNANGYGLAIWGNFLAKTMVKSSSSLHIRSFSSWDEETKQLYVYLVNKSEQKETVRIDLGPQEVDALVQRWELVGEGPDDTEPDWCQVYTTAGQDLNSFTLPQTSITVVEYRLK